MKHLFTLYFLVLFLVVKSQNIQVVSNVVNFPNTTELVPVTEIIQVFNPGIYPIAVVDVDLFTLYNRLPFVTSDTAFILNPQDTQDIALQFEPNQNVVHNMALVIKTNSGFGHVAVELVGTGTFSNAYYSSTQNLSDQALKAALKTKLGAGYNSLGYTSARDNMYGSIDNVGGDVTCVYTGRTATFNTRAGANNNQFNTEHTFPQGFFSQNEPMRSDIHHLFPTDVTANSRRGNDPFGVVGTSVTWSTGGSKSGGGLFEPRDLHKGTAARAMMYFVIRYQDYSNHFSGQEATLRSWHNSFPPSAADVARNNAIAALQTSRNPFVDYPQLEQRIFSFTTSASRPTFKSFYASDDTIQLAQVSGRYVYNYVLYNDGTEDLNLSGFSLSDTSLFFDQGTPAAVIVAPGDAYTIPISFNSTNNYLASLSFSTNTTSNPTVVVPIRSGTTIGLEESQMLPSFTVYPNPATQEVHLNFGTNKPKKISLVTLQGKSIQVDVEHTIDVSKRTKGLYFVKVEFENGYVATKSLVVL